MKNRIFNLTVYGMTAYGGYLWGNYQSTGKFGPIKTKRYYTIQHWLKTGAVPWMNDEEYEVYIASKPPHWQSEWLEWDKLPNESKGKEWF